MRSEGGLSLCVYLSVYLTSGASVRSENAVTYSAGNEDEKISLKLLALPALYTTTCALFIRIILA